MSSKLNISALFLAVLYLSLTIGIAIESHYCHGELSSVSYAIISPDCECGDEGAEMTCCSSVKQFIQLDESVVLPKVPNSSKVTETNILTHNTFLNHKTENPLPRQDEIIRPNQDYYILFKQLILYA